MAFFLTFFQNNGIIDKFDKNAHFVIFHHYFEKEIPGLKIWTILREIFFFEILDFSQNEHFFSQNGRIMR